MPLPKSCSIAARVTEAYAEAWSVVLYECWGVKPPRDEPLPPLVQLLPFIRQLLTCCACAGLLEDAMVSRSCGHCYCSKCQLGTPLLKIQCRQCKERTGLVAENQIRIVVTCYRHMCHVIFEYLTTTPSAPLKNGEFTLAKDREIPENFNPVTEILAEVVEGVKVSRNVLLVMPPSKYLNPKPPPDPPTTKKDQNSPHTNDPSTSNDPLQQHTTDDSDVPSQNEETPVSSTISSHTHHAHSKSSPSSSGPSNKNKTKRKGESNKNKKIFSRQMQQNATTKDTSGLIMSACFHSDVDFISARPAARKGTMRLFYSLKLLRMKQATPCGLEGENSVQVADDCFNKQFVSVIDSMYRVRQDVPSSSLLPQSHHRSHLSSIRTLPLTLQSPTKTSSDTRPTTSIKTKPLQRTMSTFTPRARFKILQPRYRSHYLHTTHETQSKKPKTTPEAKKITKITLTPSTSFAIPCSSSQVKKKKRGPMTPGHWRCRCGTNNPQTFDRICARGKCPCFVKNIPCNNCLCRHCKNPFNKSPEL